MKFHLSADIRGMLEKKNLSGYLTDENNRELSDKEAWEVLYDQASKGFNKIKSGECDNFDPNKGCQGHD